MFLNIVYKVMSRFFTCVFTLVFLISSLTVWASPFADTLRAEEGIESAEERVETGVSSFTAYCSKIRKTFVPEVGSLIDASNLSAIQFNGRQTQLRFNQHQNTNTNIPIHIAKQVFLI